MPPVIVAVAAAAAAWGAAAGAVGLGLVAAGSFGAYMIGMAAAMVVSFIGSALIGGPKGGDRALANDARSNAQVVRSSVAPHRLVYGDNVLSGVMVFATTSGADNVRLSMILAMAGHEVDGWAAEAWLNEEHVDLEWRTDFPTEGTNLGMPGGAWSPPDGNKFRNAVCFNFVNGDDDQTVHAGLKQQLIDAGQPDVWTDDHRLRGIAYVIATMYYDVDLFPAGIPNVRVHLRGKRLYNPVTANTEYSNNVALVKRDYLTAAYGLAAGSDAMSDASVIVAANVCDEVVDVADASAGFSVDAATDEITLATTLTSGGGYPALGDVVNVASDGALPGGYSAGVDYYWMRTSVARGKLATTLANARAGVAVDATSAGTGVHTLTRKSQVRYTADGVIQLDEKPISVIEKLNTADAGAVIYSEGAFFVHAGAYDGPPILTLTKDDLRGAIKWRSKPSRRDSFNTVKGLFVNPAKDYALDDLPVVKNDTYKAEDGGYEAVRELQLDFTQDSTRGQRILKILLEKSRQGLAIEFPAKIRALQTRAWGIVQLNIPEFGWVNKIFRITEWGLTEDFGCDLALQEEDAAVYEWNMGDATVRDPAPNTNFKSAFSPPPAPTNVALASGTAHLYLRLDGTVFSRIHVAWDTVQDIYVKSGGSIEVEYKQTASSTWLKIPSLPGAAVEAYILDVQDGESYDVRVRALNGLRVASPWSDVATHTVVGKTAVPADVTGFSAAQNGNVVVFKWTQVPDKDLAGYEIRYAPGGVAWDNATALTAVTRGTQITSAAVPPGTWRFQIKAKDTSGNFSANETLSDMVVRNTNNVVHEKDGASSWLGTRTNFMRHWTGVLVPEDTQLASAYGDELWDKMVPTPEAVCTYETRPVEIGWDANDVRVWTSPDLTLGPGHDGLAEVDTEIAYKETVGGAYGAFQPWTIGTLPSVAEVKARFTLDTTRGVVRVNHYTLTLDVQDRSEHNENVTVGVGGITITFAQRFHEVPNVQITPLGGKLPDLDSVTVTDFTVTLRSAAGADVGGAMNWKAEGP